MTMITDHVFRALVNGSSRATSHPVRRVRPGMCFYLGRCDRPRSEHITAAEYRARRST